jgi:glutamate N-acetyltransferase/amino-acid N-acetyltransferase
MTVTWPQGFRATGVACGIKSSGARDLAVVVNDGPGDAAAAVLTSNRFQAAPVQWTQQVIRDGRLRAVVINSGGANACTGTPGFQDTHATAEHAAARLGTSALDIAVCSTGLIGTRLPMTQLLDGITTAVTDLRSDGGALAAEAIMTTDSRPKSVAVEGAGYRIGGMAKGAGMLAPGLATMIVVLTTDADLAQVDAAAALRYATSLSFDRIDSDGCMSTNDSVILMASGASSVSPNQADFQEVLLQACSDLARQLIADAEGSSKDIAVTVRSANSEDDALEVARAVARSNLLKCAIGGEDPNWGRVLAATGTANAVFDPTAVDVAINGVWVCRQGGIGDDRDLVDLTGRQVEITIDLHAGSAEATILTNDLTAAYVHENSAYAT